MQPHYAGCTNLQGRGVVDVCDQILSRDFKIHSDTFSMYNLTCNTVQVATHEVL